MTVHGKARKRDCEEFDRLVESPIRAQQQVSLVVPIADLHGSAPAALVKHYRDVAWLAIVGKDFDGKWLATLSRPVTAAEIRYFIDRDVEGARQWVRGDLDDLSSNAVT